MQWTLLPLAAGLLRGHGAYEEAGLADREDRLDGLTAELMLERLRAFEEHEGRLNLEEVEGVNVSTGIHTCACVTPQDEKRRDLKNLRWLHFPKTGTSFWSTIFSYACRKKGRVDMDVSPFWRAPGCTSCYDFAVKERYPAKEYCAADAFSSLETQHRPLGHSKPENTVTFFRDPTERLLSAAINQHVSGFSQPRYHDLLQKCYQPLDPKCFVKYPGVKGCQARMLTGGTCADDGAAAGRPFPVNVPAAVALVQRLGFVGLTDEWNDSVCLFHKMYGGKVTQAEFKNFHPSHREKPDVEVQDEVDAPVYAAAKRRFQELLKQYGAQQCYRYRAAPAKCVPRTCEQDGAECGVTDDGCGGKLQCGKCPQHRAGPAVCAGTTCNAGQPHATNAFKVSSFRYSPTAPFR
jgi:hypothetical protein